MTRFTAKPSPYHSHTDADRSAVLTTTPTNPYCFVGSCAGRSSSGIWYGARSGVHCNLKVTQTSYATTMTNGQAIKYMIVAVHQGSTEGQRCAVASGDSGGPVMAYNSTYATAQGVIAALQGTQSQDCGYGV